MKFIERVGSLAGLTALLRVDLNGNWRDRDNARFLQAAQSVNFLVRKGARVVVLAHYGRPKAENHELSLKMHAGLISRLCLEPVVFIDSLDFSDAREVVHRGKDKVYLLQNLRFSPLEESNNMDFARELASLGDIYINDAFSVSHRAHASVSGITRFLPSFAGRNLALEVSALDRVLRLKKRPLTLIIGGAKIGDKLHFLRKLLPRASHVLLGGGPANTFLAARGGMVGKSIVDAASISDVRALNAEKKIVQPVDFVWERDSIMDIGPKSCEAYRKIIEESKVVVWSGPLGSIEKKKFSNGTRVVAQAIADCDAFSVIGGGETVAFIFRLGLGKKFSFISVGGSAMLDYLAYGTLPGIKELNSSKLKL